MSLDYLPFERLENSEFSEYFIGIQRVFIETDSPKIVLFSLETLPLENIWKIKVSLENLFLKFEHFVVAF